MAPIVKPSLTDTFWAHVDKNGPVSRLGTRCWNWTRSTGSHGYGELRHKGRLILVHRLSYALANGDAEAAVVAKRNELFTHNELDRVVA